MQFSCQLLFRREGEFAEHYYASLAEILPEIRKLTPHGGRPLCDSLVRSVLWAALTQDTPEVVEATLGRIGASHRQLGFPVVWYRPCGRALLDAAHALHGEDWGSALSSHWVAYYTWLSGSLASGSQAAQAKSGPDVPDPAGAEGTPSASLGAVLAELRARLFPGEESSLAAICTRVALRTGADLRNPRPDQNADPAVVRNVLDILLVLGYSLPSVTPLLTGPYRHRTAPSPSGPGAEKPPAAPATPPTAPADGLLRRCRQLFGKANR
ncbi:hypothetical protein STRCI_007903 [Streptomyces cinnabarinus]|uniref:Globin n=1 Tax=Streptomyces cinnabarinus TaxID=67287 RepID=A0ABY7KP42_9ACTN|nr:hypothetical protein [Streptomyces cinnabarinus]WAZ26339.1 hypothetical protein STRCI_007903 [Streptomyces cinnabarinus]